MTISPKFPHVSSPNPNADIDAVRAAMAASYSGTTKVPYGLACFPWFRVGSPPNSGFLARERALLRPRPSPTHQTAAMPDRMGFMVSHNALAQTTHAAVSDTVALAGIGAAAGLCFYALYLASRRRNVN